MLTQSLLDAAPFAMALIAAGLCITSLKLCARRRDSGGILSESQPVAHSSPADPMAYKVRKTKAVAGIAQTTAYIDPVGAAGVLESATQENTGPAAGELMQNNAESRGLPAEMTREARCISFGDG